MLGSSPRSGKGTFCMFDDMGCPFNHNPRSASYEGDTLPEILSVCNQCFVRVSNYFLSFCKVLGQQTIASVQHLKISLEKNSKCLQFVTLPIKHFSENLQWLLFKGKIHFPIPKSLERTRNMFTNCKYDGDVSDNSILPSTCSGIVNTGLWQKPWSIKTHISLTTASPGTVIFSRFPSMDEHRSWNSRITSWLMQEALADIFWSVPFGKGISGNKISYTDILSYPYLSYYSNIFKIC